MANIKPQEIEPLLLGSVAENIKTLNFLRRGNAFAHGVWDSLEDYPLNPLRATEGPGRNPFG
ncbi:hypothetical protein J6590_088766 [Homalodisca vitripennis]|nr:hypothetical protein J6590_088766 [Homalodisca vitripennis]